MSESLFVRKYLMFSAFILIRKLILLSFMYWLYWSMRSIGFLFFRFRFRVLIQFLFGRSFGFYNGFGVLNDRVWFTLLYIFKGFFFFIKLISPLRCFIFQYCNATRIDFEKKQRISLYTRPKIELNLLCFSWYVNWNINSDKFLEDHQIYFCSYYRNVLMSYIKGLVIDEVRFYDYQDDWLLCTYM